MRAYRWLALICGALISVFEVLLILAFASGPATAASPATCAMRLVDQCRSLPLIPRIPALLRIVFTVHR